MAVFATVLAFFQQREMRSPFKVLGVDIVMARLAGVRPHIGRARNRAGHLRYSLRRRFPRLRFLADCGIRVRPPRRSLGRGGNPPDHQGQHQNHSDNNESGSKFGLRPRGALTKHHKSLRDDR